MRNLPKSITLIITGVGVLYFGWLYYAPAIFTGGRGRVVIARCAVHLLTFRFVRIEDRDNRQQRGVPDGAPEIQRREAD
jgi:hypothetical protein